MQAPIAEVRSGAPKSQCDNSRVLRYLQYLSYTPVAPRQAELQRVALGTLVEKLALIIGCQFIDNRMTPTEWAVAGPDLAGLGA